MCMQLLVAYLLAKRCAICSFYGLVLKVQFNIADFYSIEKTLLEYILITASFSIAFTPRLDSEESMEKQSGVLFDNACTLGKTLKEYLVYFNKN